MTAQAFKVGDQVKLLQVPPQVLCDRERFPETAELFERAVGRTYEVRDFGRYGHIELWLCDDGSEDSTGAAHSIWVEPEFVQAI
jgi:hypothetical protein